MVDLGLSSQRAVSKAIEGRGKKPALCLVTHTHTDHLRPCGLKVVIEREIPVVGELATIKHIARMAPGEDGLGLSIKPNRSYTVHDLTITPFRLPHDCPTLGFLFEHDDGSKRMKLVWATDLGSTPDHLLPFFIDADIVVLEANYDDALLDASFRHPLNKERIRSDFGHLSNLQAGGFLSRVFEGSTRLPKKVVLSHLSFDHNTEELAKTTVEKAISGAGGCQILVASRISPTPTVEVRREDEDLEGRRAVK
jgi:phosphoribosyl 1,2-cyclic phosphodiesterase